MDSVAHQPALLRLACLLAQLRKLSVARLNDQAPTASRGGSGGRAAATQHELPTASVAASHSSASSAPPNMYVSNPAQVHVPNVYLGLPATSNTHSMDARLLSNSSSSGLCCTEAVAAHTTSQFCHLMFTAEALSGQSTVLQTSNSHSLQQNRQLSAWSACHSRYFSSASALPEHTETAKLHNMNSGPEPSQLNRQRGLFAGEPGSAPPASMDSTVATEAHLPPKFATPKAKHDRRKTETRRNQHPIGLQEEEEDEAEDSSSITDGTPEHKKFKRSALAAIQTTRNADLLRQLLENLQAELTPKHLVAALSRLAKERSTANIRLGKHKSAAGGQHQNEQKSKGSAGAKQHSITTEESGVVQFVMQRMLGPQGTLSQCNARAIATLAYALARLDCFQQDWWQAIGNRLTQDDCSLLKGMEVAYLTNCLWALAKANYRHENFWMTAAVTARQALQGSTDTTAKLWANTLWAFATIGWRDHSLCEAAVAACMDLKFLKEAKPEDVTQILWALASLRHPLSKVCSALSGHVSSGFLDDTRPQNVAKWAWVYAVAEHYDEQMMNKISKLVSKRDFIVAAGTQDWGMLMWAFSKLRHYDAQACNAAVTGLMAHIDRALPKHIATVLWSLTVLGHSPQDSLRIIGSQKAVSKLTSKQLQPDDGARALWALCAMHAHDETSQHSAQTDTAAISKQTNRADSASHCMEAIQKLAVVVGSFSARDLARDELTWLVQVHWYLQLHDLPGLPPDLVQEGLDVLAVRPYVPSKAYALAADVLQQVGAELGVLEFVPRAPVAQLDNSLVVDFLMRLQNGREVAVIVENPKTAYAANVPGHICGTRALQRALAQLVFGRDNVVGLRPVLTTAADGQAELVSADLEQQLREQVTKVEG